MSRWTPAAEDTIRRMWNEGATASEIAAQLPDVPATGKRKAQKVSRNMVIGKAHRMGLAARPSPIKTKEPAE